MNDYELLDLIGDQLHLILDNWNFFVSAHIAVLGILFITHRSISPIERLLAIVAYSGFMAINYSAQSKNYAYLRDLTQSYHGYKSIETIAPPATIYFTFQGVPVGWVEAIYAGSLIGTVLVLALLNIGRERE